jgi:hypothetical protein
VSAAVVGAGTGAGAEGLMGETMSEMSEMSSAKSVIVFPWLAWFVYI